MSRTSLPMYAGHDDRLGLRRWDEREAAAASLPISCIISVKEDNVRERDSAISNKLEVDGEIKP